MIAMAQAVTLLTVLQTFNAQRTCESGSPVLERYSKSAFNKGYDMIKSDLSPEAVLSKCREHCNVNPGLCTGFSFKPGKWIGTRWEDSSCVFSKDKFIQGGINYERAYEMEYFNQICLNRGRMEEVCNNRTYAFTVYPDMEVVLNDTSIVQARDRIDCMDKCLAEERFTCRSAIYDRNGVCHISRFSSSNMKSMRGSYFMENECLHGLSRCEGFTQYIKEENANIVNSKIMTRISDANLDDCVKICRDDLGVLAFNCKSFTYNAATQHCFLSDENSLSLVQKIATTPSETLYELFCVEGAKPENNEKAGVAYLYGRENRYYEEEVPFQRYRNSILQAEFSQTIREVELSRCLDECLHASPKCMSIVYSARSRECKLSTFNQRDSRILYDPFFDYYENIIDQAAGPGGPLPNRNPNLGISSPIDKSNRKLFGSVFLPPEVPALPPLSSVVNPFSPEVNPLGPFRPLSPTSILFPGGPQDNIGYYDRYPGAFRPSPPSPGRYPPITGPPIRYPSGGRTSRCDPGTGDSFRQVRSRTRLRQQFIRRLATVNSLFECEQECLRERIFKCLSFNYIVGFSPTTEENCELSEKNSYDYDIDNPVAFEQSERFDYYQREAKQEFTDDSCLDVSQTCDQDGMAFTLKTPEGFRGRIYTHNNYGRSGCYVRGTGGNLHTLRIPGSGGFPDCGTGQYGDTITNIVVVQFSEDIQTNMDMKYNLTCTTRGPGSAVVTSGYIGAGSGQPVPIEYLPAEHTLDSRVRLVIKYQDRPTTTIAVGDPLQFKLETQEGENLLRDIFATNVIAKDPYSDRIVELIDSRGCPIDPYVFPALGLSRAADGLETSFNAFKIPESNFLVFEATVRSCRSGCRPAVCDGPSGRDNSFGRRRRESDSTGDKKQEETDKGSKMEIREMFRVYETRSSIPENGQVEVIRAKEATVCLVSSSYKGMLVGLIVLGLLLTLVSTLTLILYRRSRKSKSVHDMSDPGTVLSSQQMSKLRHLKESKIVPQERYLPPWKHTPGEAEDVRWQDPSEPIYTDPSLFEKM